MPQLGMTMTQGTITRWLKNVGDQVTKGEPIFEIETDKVKSEIEAEASGTLSNILVPEDGTVDVGETVAILDVQ